LGKAAPEIIVNSGDLSGQQLDRLVRKAAAKLSREMAEAALFDDAPNEFPLIGRRLS
jgi:hypothetical protein